MQIILSPLDLTQKQTMYEASYDQTMIYLDETLPPLLIDNSLFAQPTGSGSTPTRQAQRYRLSDLRYLEMREIRPLEHIVSQLEIEPKYSTTEASSEQITKVQTSHPPTPINSSSAQRAESGSIPTTHNTEHSKSKEPGMQEVLHYIEEQEIQRGCT